MNCPKCDAVNDDHADQCVNCGESLNTKSTQQVESEPLNGHISNIPPRSRKKDYLIIGGAVGLVIMLLIISIVVINDYNRSNVNVSTGRLQIIYDGTSSGYISAQQEQLRLGGYGGEQFNFTISLENRGSAPHNITEIDVVSPFTLVSVYPSIPSSISPGDQVMYYLTIAAPPSSGDYSLSITVHTN